MDLFEPESALYATSQHLFIRGLGFIYFLAFWSLSRQVLGLYGSNGILPISQTIKYIKQQKIPFSKIPSLFFFISTDSAIKGLSVLGQILSLLVMLDFFSTLWLILLWIIYFSFLKVGSVFLSFQWDILLLETGFLAIFFSMQTPPAFLLLIALWFLLFRLMFFSGIIKLLSGCKEWRDLSALSVHYETQPLPNKIAYYMHQMPAWFSKSSTLILYALEIIVPFFIFGGKDLQLLAFILLVFLQIMIILTGNYAFFNLLSIVLCIPLLQNEYFPTILQVSENGSFLLVDILLNAIGACLIVLNGLILTSLFFPSYILYKIIYPFEKYYILNSYGLFAHMTTTRNEIIIEGSEDGENWLEYEFKWKPGNVKEAPKQVAPHQPRLDWQMWFAALETWRQNPWFIYFLEKLLVGSKEIESLLKYNPFPNMPPRYIRALLYSYSFTDLETKKATGKWWNRTLVGPYSPIFTKKE